MKAGKMATALERFRFPELTRVSCRSDWASEACYSHLPSAHFYLFALGSLVLPSVCSGQVGLPHQTEKSNIFLVCLSLWHLNKPEKCINLAKDWSRSDG